MGQANLTAKDGEGSEERPNKTGYLLSHGSLKGTKGHLEGVVRLRDKRLRGQSQRCSVRGRGPQRRLEGHRGCDKGRETHIRAAPTTC